MSFQGIAPIQFGMGVSGVTQTLGVNDGELGTKVTKDGNDYVCLYNGGTASTVNKIVQLQSGASGYSVSASSTVETGYIFAVVANTGIAAGDYFYGLTRGFADLEPITAVVSGAILVAAASGHVEPPAVATAATAHRGPVQAIAQEATAACGAVKCYISAWG